MDDIILDSSESQAEDDLLDSLLSDTPSGIRNPDDDRPYLPSAPSQSVTLDFTSLDAKKTKLNSIRAALKTEFFGIDGVIDKIVDNIQTWYLIPSAITRPQIINLFSLTGCGKTSLVRSLVSHLGMTDRFLEIQMDGFSGGLSNETKTIFGLLTNHSGIAEGQPGIILLDEFQRFRTISDKGEDVKLERYPDVWMLLSDGRFPSDHSKLERILDYMDMQEYYDDQYAQQTAENDAKVEAGMKEAESPAYKKLIKRERKFLMMRHEADDIKSMLRRPEPLKDIMQWPKAKVRQLVNSFLAANENRPFDYTKCLVFVSGNLDEAYRMSASVEDCDTSADVFYQHTLKIGVPEIKTALGSRFRPEQIARLGNNHVIYPALQEYAYHQLIKRTCLQYVEEVGKVCNITFSIDQSVYQEIYDNAVYPTQGTRPVFTSIHKLFGSPLSDAVLWGLEHKVDHIVIGLDILNLSLTFKAKDHSLPLSTSVKIDFEIRARRKSRSADFNALVAVHEAGHAIVYAALFKRAPWEVAINVASFKGGYNLYRDTFLSKHEVLHKVAVSMAGIVAEEMIFGQELRSTGCASDVTHATTMSSMYVRRYAMDEVQGTVGKTMDNLWLEGVVRTDEAIETVIRNQKARAQTIITEHRTLLIDLSNQLLKTPKMDGAAFMTLVDGRIPELAISQEQDVNGDYAARLAKAGCVGEG